MAEFDVNLIVDFLDAAERITRLTYLLRTLYDTAANAGDGNMPDVLSDAADALTAINVLTGDATPEYQVALTVPGSGTPSVASNNQVRAFTRIYDEGDAKGSIIVPAWDDVVFDEDNQNLIDPAYNTAAAALALLLRNPETGTNFALVPQYSQSRTRKSRNIIND